jgi:hypothetical protein
VRGQPWQQKEKKEKERPSRESMRAHVIKTVTKIVAREEGTIAKGKADLEG